MSFLGGIGMFTRSLVLKYTRINSRLPTMAQNRAMHIYLVFSSSVPDKLNLGRIKPSTIKKAVGTAEPTPLAVRALLIMPPRSSALGVKALGSAQKGTSEAV